MSRNQDKSLIFDFEGKYFCFLSSYPLESENYALVRNGDGAVAMCDLKNCHLLNFDNDMIAGETIEIERSDENLRKIFSALSFRSLSHNSYSDDIKIYYGLGNHGDKNVTISGKKINTQIVVTRDKIVVGFPVVLGSY